MTTTDISCTVWPARIRLVVFDFDGVMTDNRVLVFEDGREGVFCSRADGLGIASLKQRGVPMMILSTEKNSVVATRARKLGIPAETGIDDKGAFLCSYLERHGIAPAEVAYIGNDTNDLDCLHQVGLPVVVADAHPDARAAAKLVLCRIGGDAAVREFCDLLAARLSPNGYDILPIPSN